MRKFRTDDGFILELKNDLWTDGDLEFNNEDGKPIGDDGLPLDGKFIREPEPPDRDEARGIYDSLLADE